MLKTTRAILKLRILTFIIFLSKGSFFTSKSVNLLLIANIMHIRTDSIWILRVNM